MTTSFPILLVEDNPDDVFIFQRTFRQANLTHPLEVIGDGESAIQYLSGIGAYADRERYPLPAVIFLDIGLPQKSGFDVLSWLRKQPDLQHLPVVMLTISTELSSIKYAYDLGANSYLIKPVSPGSLKDVINTLVPPKDRLLRLLLIDDNADDRFMALRELRKEFPDFKVQEVEDENGLSQSLASGNFDLVITDYDLQFIDGLTILRSIKARWPNCPVIMLTGTGSEEIAVEAMKAGLDDYVLKSPQHIVRLTQAIRVALEKKHLRDRHEQAEKRVRESEKKYRRLSEEFHGILNAIPDNLTLQSPDLKVVWANQGAADGLSKKVSDLIGQYCYQLWHGRSTPCESCPVEKSFRTGNSEKEQVTTPDGRIWELRTVPVFDDEGKVKGVIELGRNITEPMRTEKALRESEERFRTLFYGIPVGLYRTKQTGEILDANPALARMFGAKDDKSLNGININQFYLDPGERLLQQTIVKQDGFLYDFEIRIRRLDGKVIWVEDDARAVFDADGDILYYEGSLEDITQRKEAEIALQNSEERFRELYDDAPVGYHEMDTEGRITRVNRTESKILGYAIEEMLGHKVWEFIVEQEDSQKAFLSKVAGTIPPGQGFERTYRRKDGSTFTAMIDDRILYDEKGGIKGIRSTIQDISERKMAERKTLSAVEEWSETFDSMADGISIHNVDFEILNVNETLSKFLGKTKEELLHKKCYQIFHGKDAPISGCPLEKTKVSRGKEFFEVFEPSLKLWLSVSISPIFDKDGEIKKVIHSLRNITEHKQAEEKLIALQEQLHQSVKMEAIGRLAGGISHDFNNLLTIIKGYSQLSLLDLKEGDPLKGNLDEIRMATDRAAALTRQLLAFSRRQTMEMKVIDLNSLIKDLEKMLRRVIGEDIELVTVLTKDLGNIRTDPAQMEQVVLNLAVNARDAMPNGGKLTIETSNVMLDEEYPRTHIDITPGHYVMLSVSDMGVGMTKEVKEKIFEPFFTTKEKGKGTGLGLSTVYGIVKQSGGDIWVISELGQGATFKVYLPRVEEPLEELKAKEELKELPRGKETVLVVEDEDEVRNLAKTVLKRQGYKVLEARDGGAALLFFEKWKEPIQLILTDVVMPHMSGPQLIERLQNVKKDFKVLYMSGYPDDTVYRHGILEEGSNYIQKPFPVEDLARKVRDVLDKK